MNYGHIQVFDNATTYSAITIFDKKDNKTFNYEYATSIDEFTNRKIKVSEIQDKKIWQLTIKESDRETKGVNWVELKNIPDLSIHVGLSTLADKAYIFSIIERGKKFTKIRTKLKGEVKIETSELLKPIIKGSTFKIDHKEVKEYILFPYIQQDGKYKIIEEALLQTKYPKTYTYLTSVREFLDKRDNGKPNPIAWYAFGRQQSIDNGFGEKIIFSPMSKNPNFIYSDNEKATVYSGYYIKYKGDYSKLLEQLNSERMAEYIEVSSRSFRGGWKAYNKKVLESFLIDTTKL